MVANFFSKLDLPTDGISAMHWPHVVSQLVHFFVQGDQVCGVSSLEGQGFWPFLVVVCRSRTGWIPFSFSLLCRQERLFQSGLRIAEAYKSHVKRPYGSSITQARSP